MSEITGQIINKKIKIISEKELEIIYKKNLHKYFFFNFTYRISMQTVLLSYLLFYEFVIALTIVPLSIIAHYYPNVHHYQFGLLIIPHISILVVFEILTRDYLGIHFIFIYFFTFSFLMIIDYKDIYYVLTGKRSVFDMDRRLRKYYDKLVDRSIHNGYLDPSKIENLDSQN